jgi:hypothetical protein
MKIFLRQFKNCFTIKSKEIKSVFSFKKKKMSSQQQSILQTLTTPGALLHAVNSNPSLRSFYWVQAELESQGKLKTGNDMVGATTTHLSRTNVWSKPGNLELCPYRTLPGDVLPSETVEQQQQKRNALEK